MNLIEEEDKKKEENKNENINNMIDINNKKDELNINESENKKEKLEGENNKVEKLHMVKHIQEVLKEGHGKSIIKICSTRTIITSRKHSSYF